MTCWSLIRREDRVRYYYWQEASMEELSEWEELKVLVALSDILVVMVMPIVLGRTDLNIGKILACITNL